MDPVLVVARHPHVSAAGSGGIEQAQELRAEPARSGGLPHTSHALGSGGVAGAAAVPCRRERLGPRSVGYGGGGIHIIYDQPPTIVG